MPAALAGAEGIAILALIASFIVLIGMQKGWSVTFGWIFRTLGDMLQAVKILGLHPLSHVAKWLYSLDRNVYHALGVAALGCEGAASWLWHQTANQVAWVGREIADLARDTAQALGAVNTTIVKPAVKIIDRNSVVRIGKVSASLAVVVGVQIPKLIRGLADVRARVAHLTRTVAVDVARVNARVGTTAKQMRRLGSRVSRLEKVTAGLGAVALVGTALARMGLSWVRCPNVGRAGRAVCGMDADLLDSLLGSALLLTSAISIEQLARELQEPTVLVTDALHSLVDEF